jgi:2-methylcitrate dehydratase PrpD
VDATFLFAKNFVDTRFEDLPPEVVEITKKQVLDLLGVGIRGFSMAGAKELRELILDWGGKEEATIMGTTKKVPAPNAAHVNATMVHSLDYDDVHEAGVMHPGVIAVPTAMTVAELKGGLTGKEFVTAVALGTDIMCRFGLSTTPGRSPIEVGWHQTSLFGFMGSAAVAGRTMGLSEEQIINAMGIAYAQASGNGQAVKDGALTKRLGPGFSVKGGMMAALLAEKGITGAHNCLDADWGLYKLYWRGDYDPVGLVADLGKRFEGPNVSIKPYPCCRGIHPAIDAALALVKEHDIKAGNVERIRLFVTDAHYKLLSTPLDVKLRPRSPVDAQFSIPWGVATAIVKGRGTGLDDYTDTAVKDPEILAMTAKTQVEIDNGLQRGDKIEPTRVEITMKSGEVYASVVEHPLGSPERPMSFDDCAVKFRDCAQRIGGARMDKVIELVGRLESLEDVTDIMKQLVLEG